MNNVHTEQCSAYGIVSLLCNGYIKAEESQFTEIQRRHNTAKGRKNPSEKGKKLSVKYRQ